MRERVTHETNLAWGIFLKHLFHTFFNTCITHLPSFISFHGLAFEYCLYQIQTLVSPLNHRFSFFFRIPRTDFKLRASIFHTLSLIQSSVSPSVFTLMQTKLIEKINPFMLCMPNKFLYQNQQQNTRYITFYTNTQKFPHLLSPSNRFYQIRLQHRSMTKHLVHKK